MTRLTSFDCHFVIAVILSHNSKESLIRVIKAVKEQTYPVSRLVVIDNGSNDGTEILLNGLCSEIKTIFLHENVGVGAGHNTGWLYALGDPSCEFIWSLEHDCIPTSDCLQRLLETYAKYISHQKIGACVPLQVVSQHRDGLHYYVWRKNRFIQVNNVQRHLEPYMGRGFTFNGVLLPIDIVRQIGFLNSEFFIGHEDTDYSRRVRQAGFTLLHVPAAVVNHDILRTRKEIKLFGRVFLIPGGSVLRSYYETRNAIYLAKGHHGMSRLLLQNLMKLPLSILFIICFSDAKKCRIQARLHAIRDGLRGELGRKSYNFL